MPNCTPLPHEWRHRPLCRRYLFLLADTLRIPVQAGARRHSLWSFTWALGVTADGQSEVVGVWPEDAFAGPPVAKMVIDLRLRGVQHVGFFKTGEAAPIEGALEPPFQGSLGYSRLLQADSAVHLSAAQQRILNASEKTLGRLKRLVQRSVVRCSPKRDLSDAIGCVTEALERAERGLESEGRSRKGTPNALRSSLEDGARRSRQSPTLTDG